MAAMEKTTDVSLLPLVVLTRLQVNMSLKTEFLLHLRALLLDSEESYEDREI